jgi:hypothetical protein
MNHWWTMAMLISGGIFAGAVITIAWERIPAWRSMELAEFRHSFADTLRRVDRLQPALLVVCLVSTIGFTISASAPGRAPGLPIAASVLLLLVLVGSVGWLVPIQRRLVREGSTRPSPRVDTLRRQWIHGHLIRTVLTLAALLLIVAAVVL